MPFLRVLLRDDRGTPVASAKVGGVPPRVTLPDGITALCCLSGEIFPVHGSSFLLPTREPRFSLIARRGEEMLFASTLTSEEAAYEKWRLLSFLDKGVPREEEVLTDESVEASATASERENDPPTDTETAERDLSESRLTEITEEAAERPESEIERAERLLASGTPFPLFESMMQGSRWALVHEEDAEYLIGITEDGHVLVGVPGSRDYPPDEETLWSFFPTDEEGETGYFLTESLL